MRWFDLFDSPFSGFKSLVLIGDAKGLQALKLIQENQQFAPQKDWQHNSQIFAETRAQLLAYAKGELRSFELKLNPQGTEFQKQVWQALQTIPYGETRTYQHIAEHIGKPKSYRPVGNANNKNPIPIIIPCHRVLPKNGAIGGYTYGTQLKAQLLALEAEHYSQPMP